MAQQKFWIFVFLLVVFVVQGGQSSEDYDPWKETDRPKVVVDYHTGPLRGKNDQLCHTFFGDFWRI